jgi:hypothetical protein
MSAFNAPVQARILAVIPTGKNGVTQRSFRPSPEGPDGWD